MDKRGEVAGLSDERAVAVQSRLPANQLTVNLASLRFGNFAKSNEWWEASRPSDLGEGVSKIR